MTPGERLSQHWSARGAAVRPGVPVQTIDELERKLLVRLPTDFRAYLALVNGMAQPLDVRPPIEFWSVARIAEDHAHWGCFESGTPGTLLPFADLLLSSSAYAIRVTSEDASVFFVGGADYIVQCARTFSEFVELYARDDDALYG